MRRILLAAVLAITSLMSSWQLLPGNEVTASSGEAASSCTSTNLVVTISDAGSDIIDLCLTNVVKDPTGTITADILITNKKAIWYNMSFDASGGVSIPRKSGDLIILAQDAAKKLGTKSAFLPLLGKHTTPIPRVIFPPNSRLVITLKKWGDVPYQTLGLFFLGAGSAFASAFGSFDIGNALEGDPSVATNVLLDLLKALNNVGFDLAGFTYKLSQDDYIGAAGSLAAAMQAAPEVFAPILGISPSVLGKLAERLLTLVGFVPFLFDSAFAPRTGGFSVEPPIKLIPGSTTTITRTITTPNIPAKPDVVFLADTTGSMGGAISNVQAKAAQVMNDVRAVQPDAQFGVAEYKDFNCDATPYRLDQAVTAATTAIQSGISAWAAGGGCDTPEAQLNALYRLATDPAIGWRGGATRIVAWFGDAPGHDPSNGYTLAAVKAALVAANIRVVAVNVYDLDGCGESTSCGQATAITRATGGTLLGLSTSAIAAVGPTGNDNAGASTAGEWTLAAASDVGGAILAGLTSLPVTVTPQISSGSPYVTITPDPPSKTVVSGETVTFTITIAVAATIPPGTVVNPRVDFLLDGRLATEPAVATPLQVLVPTRLAWSAWASQGGVLTDAPAAASFNGRLYAFAVGTDPRDPGIRPLYVKSSDDGAAWSDWASLGGNLTDAPAAAAFNGRLYVFAKGVDPANPRVFPLYAKSSADGATWTDWQFLGGNLTAAPAAAAFGGRLYAFAKGVDPANPAVFPLYAKSSADGAAFGDWQFLGGNLTAAPAAAAFNGRLYVFAKGVAGGTFPLYVKSSADGAAFGDWANLGGNLTAAPAAASYTRAGGLATLVVLARGDDGALYAQATTDGTAYDGWQSLGGQPVGAPAAVGLGGRLYVLVRWADNALYERHTTP